MIPRTWLDGIVYRFQHRWETNPQFRAAATGAIGLIVVIGMCACMGIFAVVTNTALASMGAGSGGIVGSLDTGTQKLAAPTAFPTDTVPPYAVGNVPAVSPIPNSQTPVPSPSAPPSPTPRPSPTPCQPNCGGGGGGGGGNHGTVSGSASPNPWVPGQTGTINVHTSAPNIGIAIILQYANGVTQTYEPAGQTDGNGDFTYSVQVQNNPGTAKITIMANFSPIAYADVFQPVQ
jgi:hypothetical protein